ncbi:NAD(P)/FAD-dependent oxidoreductase [Shimazuella kribbensis]|uniref:NAD(P)/FAD-dependent oxidoreductase n=1 Tax=Shimazuella kribbensis TaxID=139808 RepID=UPI00048EA323|nr:FAD-dependent oxidoreductase [Shimazuella kribbensis]
MYDITIVGAGIAGVFLAYELADSGQKILLLDRGKRLEDRHPCPLDQANTCECNACDTYFGFGGLGKSEGKFNYSNGFGGELEQKVGAHTFKNLMRRVDDVLCRFGADTIPVYSTFQPNLSKRAEEAGLNMIHTDVRHLGTVKSIQVLQELYLYLLDKIDMKFECEIASMDCQYDYFSIRTKQEVISSKQVVLATGRSGSDWLTKIWDSFGISPSKTRLDLGIRVEMKAEQFRSVLQRAFETKLSFHHGEKVTTTYCMNPRGRIVRKYQDGLVMPDGQNYREKGSIGTANLNFTLFTPTYFSTQQAADQYAHAIIEKINRDKARIVVQRWEDLCNGMPTCMEMLVRNEVKPTLEADCGDLLEEVPGLYIAMLQTFFTRLEHFIQEPIHPDTLLYGMDAKFYAPVIPTDPYMQTEVNGLFVVGDCSGISHSLSQAAACGLYVGEFLKQQY